MKNTIAISDSTNLLMVNAVAVGELFRSYYTSVNIQLKEDVVKYYDSMIEEATQPELIKYLRKSKRSSINKFKKDVESFSSTLDKAIDTYKSHNNSSNEIVENIIDNLDKVMNSMITVKEGVVSVEQLKIN